MRKKKSNTFGFVQIFFAAFELIRTIQTFYRTCLTARNKLKNPSGFKIIKAFGSLKIFFKNIFSGYQIF